MAGPAEDKQVCQVLVSDVRVSVMVDLQDVYSPTGMAIASGLVKLLLPDLLPLKATQVLSIGHGAKFFDADHPRDQVDLRAGRTKQIAEVVGGDDAASIGVEDYPRYLCVAWRS
jgi:hypothetical protein